LTEFLRKVYQSVCEYLSIPAGTTPERSYPFDVLELCHRFSLDVQQTQSAMRLLSQEGLWTMNEGMNAGPTVQVILSRPELDQMTRDEPDQGLILTTLLRMYSGIYYSPESIHLASVGRRCGMSQDQIRAYLDRLKQVGAIDYAPAQKGSFLHVHHYRVDANHLIIHEERIETLRAQYRVKYDAMVGYLNYASCREQYVLQYFGEMMREPCGRCDNCLKREPKDHAGLEASLQTMIAAQPGLSLRELSEATHPFSKQEIAASLRQMLAQELILRDEDGGFFPAA
jgi:ATP-dependent DNA helicase RecQ